MTNETIDNQETENADETEKEVQQETQGIGNELKEPPGLSESERQRRSELVQAGDVEESVSEVEATALSIIRPEIADFTGIKGIPSFKNQFAIYSDRRIAYALRKHELASAADFYEIDYGRRIREMELVGKLRTHLTTRTCRCTDDHENLIDTRWRRIDEGLPIYIGLGPKLSRTYGGWFADAVAWVVEETGSDKLNFEVGPVVQMPNATPDIYSELNVMDGKLGTMGAAHRFESGALDRGKPPYAFLELDVDENWYQELFVYVTGHELLHILGLGHGPIDNVMFKSVPQNLRENFGVWDLAEVNGRIPRTVDPAIA